MTTLLQAFAILAIITGAAFSTLGVLGYYRLPDVYTRLHATGKVSVFGVVLLVVAAAVLTPLGFGKGLVLIFMLVLGGPVASHAIASAAHTIGIPLARTTRDDLAVVQDAAPFDPGAGS